jgi:RNA polymerase sigma-70 factor (ECF subfamily)
MVADEERLKALMLRGLAGDAAAHRVFLQAITPSLRSYLRSRLRSSPEDAEDLLQETILAVHTRRESYDQSYPVTAWLYAIARYRLIDHLRRRGRRGIAVPIDDIGELAAASPSDDAADARHDIDRLLQRLPAKQQDAIRLVKLEQLSVKEAAARTGYGESDIKVSIHRGLKTLAALMVQERDR